MSRFISSYLISSSPFGVYPSVCMCVHISYGLQWLTVVYSTTGIDTQMGSKWRKKAKESFYLYSEGPRTRTHTRTHWHTQKKSDRALFAMRSTFFEGERSRTPLLIAVAYSSSIFGCQYIPIPSSLISLCLPLDTPLAPEAIQAIPNVSCVSFAKRSLLHLHEKRLRPRWWPNRFMI